MSRFELCYDENSHVIDADGYLQSADVSYLIFDHENETDVLDYARTVIPNKITFRERSIELESIEIMERKAQDVWKITAHYPANKDNNTEEQSEQVSEFSFDISAGTKHITHSKQTIFSAAAKEGESAPNYGGAINVNQDNKIDGVDIVNSVFSFTEKHYFSNSIMDNDFKRQIASLVGKVNNGSFKQWEAGEVLFMGATGSRRGKTSKDKWEVTFRFSVSMNATNLEVGTITVPNKNGWDYLWVKYANDVSGNVLTKKIEAVYVERVYDYESFNPLK